MKVLDANFLIDYLKANESTKKYYEANGADSERWIMPVPAYAEVLVGEGNFPDGDVTGARNALKWGVKHAIDDHTATLAAQIAEEVGPQGPYLDGVDALVAAVGRELDAPVVSADSDLTHDETKRVIDVEEYRD